MHRADAHPAKGLPLAGENDLPGMDQRPPTYDAYLWASKLDLIFAKEAATRHISETILTFVVTYYYLKSAAYFHLTALFKCTSWYLIIFK